MNDGDGSKAALDSLNRALEVARERLQHAAQTVPPAHFSQSSSGPRLSSSAQHSNGASNTALSERVVALEKENTRLLKQLKEVESTAAELADEYDSVRRTADSATAMVERLQTENADLRQRLANETSSVDDVTRQLAADASRAQRQLENKHAAELRELREELFMARDAAETLKERLSGKDDALSVRLREAQDAQHGGLTAAERAAADAAEACLARDAAEARAVAAESAAEAAKAEAREALAAVAGLDAGLAATWRRMEGAMSDGIANAAAAAAALIAESENTLQAKLRSAHEKADRLSERCATLDAQLFNEQNASVEAARLRRAAAALLALNERLLERLSPGTGTAGGGDSDLSTAHPHHPHHPPTAALAFAADTIRDSAVLEGLRAAVDLANWGPSGSAHFGHGRLALAGQGATGLGSGVPRGGGAPPSVGAVAAAAAARSQANARPAQDPLLALARTRAGLLSRQEMHREVDTSAAAAAALAFAAVADPGRGWRTDASSSGADSTLDSSAGYGYMYRRPHSAPFGSAPFGRGGILEEEDIDEGGEEDYDNGKGDQADRPPLVAKRRVAARRRAPATAAAAVGAAAPRAHRVPSSSSRAAPAARQASYSSAPRAPRATRGLQGPSRDGVTSTASGPARPSTAAPAYPAGARGASPYSTRAWLPPPSAANPLHHPAPLAGFGATEGGSMGEGEGQQTSVRARGTARPGLKGRAISGRAPLPSSAVPSGATDALLTAADALQREFESARSAYEAALGSVTALGGLGAGQDAAAAGDLQRAAQTMQEKCRALVSVLATVGGQQQQQRG